MPTTPLLPQRTLEMLRQYQALPWRVQQFLASRVLALNTCHYLREYFRYCEWLLKPSLALIIHHDQIPMSVERKFYIAI